MASLFELLRSFDYSIKCLTITPDGKQVISGGFDGEIKIWNAEKDDSSITMEGHTDEVNTVAITRDGKKVFSFSKDHTARVWDMETGKELYTIRHTKEEFSAINFSTDGRYAILGFSMGEVKILNLNTWQEESDLGFDTLTGIHKQLLMADGRHLISLDGDGQIEMWDIDTWQVIWNRPGTHGQTKHLIVQTPDSQKIIDVKTGILSSEIVVINPITGEEIDSVHQGDWSDITAAAVTPDGVDAIFADRFNVLHIWNIEKRQETRDIRAYRSHSGFASSLAVTPDGRQIVSGGMDQSLLIWNFELGQEVQGYDGHKGKTLSVAISPDGKQIISGSKDKTLKKWNLEPETEIKIPTRHNDEVIAIAIDPDGERVISVSKNDAMIIWSLETGQIYNGVLKQVRSPNCKGNLAVQIGV